MQELSPISLPHLANLFSILGVAGGRSAWFAANLSSPYRQGGETTREADSCQRCAPAIYGYEQTDLAGPFPAGWTEFEDEE